MVLPLSPFICILCIYNIYIMPTIPFELVLCFAGYILPSFHKWIVYVFYASVCVYIFFFFFWSFDSFFSFHVPLHQFGKLLCPGIHSPIRGNNNNSSLTAHKWRWSARQNRTIVAHRSMLLRPHGFSLYHHPQWRSRSQALGICDTLINKKKI